jgi:cyanophycinase
MTQSKLAFLIGGSDAYEVMTDAFLAAAGGELAHIALLLQQGGERLPRILQHYSEPWSRRGFSRYQPVFPEPDGRLDLARTREILQAATGIFVGGGSTPTYHRLYASGPVGNLIRERYEAGLPFAGVSAGAMVAMEHCVFEAVETPDHTLQVVPGLGLVKDYVIGVHYTEQMALPELLEAMSKGRTRKGLGIDDAACAVFENGRFVGILGHSAYEIEMWDFEQRFYSIGTCRSRYVGSMQ